MGKPELFEARPRIVRWERDMVWVVRVGRKTIVISQRGVD